MNNPNDEKWLMPLKNRSDLEPNPEFVRNLKTTLLNSEEKNMKSKSHFGDMKFMIPMVLSVLLFSVITVSFINSKENSQLPSGDDPNEVINNPDITNEKSLDIAKLIEENTTYKNVYDHVFKVTGDETSAVVIYYFEALRLQNEELVAKYAFDYSDKKMISKIIEFYKSVDFTTIKVEEVVPSQAEPAFEIIFSYQEQNSGAKKMKNIFLEFPYENQAMIYDSLEEIQNEVDPNLVFELTEEEISKYEEFKTNYDETVLRGVSPISVAKIYIQAGIDGDWETEYELYTKREDRIMWSKEKHKQYSEQEQTNPDQIKESYAGIMNGTFQQTSDYEGYISFLGKDGEKGFQMVKDENGVWKVGFMPIQ